MVNFTIIVDTDAKRRSAFIRQIKSEISPVEGLSERICSFEDFSIIWAAGSWTPISSAIDEEGLAILWGDANNWSQSDRASAEQLRQFWKDPVKKPSDPFDGFHTGVSAR